jgi:hypothetical protein
MLGVMVTIPVMASRRLIVTRPLIVASRPLIKTWGRGIVVTRVHIIRVITTIVIRRRGCVDLGAVIARAARVIRYASKQ